MDLTKSLKLGLLLLFLIPLNDKAIAQWSNKSFPDYTWPGPQDDAPPTESRSEPEPEAPPQIPPIDFIAKPITSEPSPPPSRPPAVKPSGSSDDSSKAGRQKATRKADRKKGEGEMTDARRGNRSSAKIPPMTPPPAEVPPSPTESSSTEGSGCIDCSRPAQPIQRIQTNSTDVLRMTSDPNLDIRCSKPDGTFDARGGFAGILAKARQDAKLSKSTCPREMKRIACHESPWKNLTLEQRYQRILTLGKPFADDYSIDVRAMACIAAIETTDLNPLSKFTGSCSRNSSSSAQGLGQTTLDTLSSYVEDGGKKLAPFRSKIPPFNEIRSGTAQDARDLFNAMGNSVALQLEILAYTLKEKRNYRNNNDYEMFRFYYGNFKSGRQARRSRSYADGTNKCMKCMYERTGADGQAKPGKESGLNCLSLTVPIGQNRRHQKSDNKIQRSFDQYQRQCNRLTKNDYRPLCSPSNGTKSGSDE